MTDAPELLPCPFCGDTKSQRAVWVGLSYRVVCLPPLPLGMGDCADEFDEHDFYTGCGAMGVGHKTEKDAIAAWNTRADAARKTQEAVAAERQAVVEECLALIPALKDQEAWVANLLDRIRTSIIALAPDGVRTDTDMISRADAARETQEAAIREGEA